MVSLMAIDIKKRNEANTLSGFSGRARFFNFELIREKDFDFLLFSR